MSRHQSGTALAGVLVVDKPTGSTSHAVVQQVRRALGIRRVGHAGTLDPLASGVLVVMVGEATKLAPFLTAEDKSYAAVVRLGAATSTLDAEGEITEQGSMPHWLLQPEEREARIARALELERGRTSQSPPLHSAIKIHGRAAYALARAGEPFALSPRPVKVHELRWEALNLEPAEPPAQDTGRQVPGYADLELVLTVGKGYYVRSLARDLGGHLGVPAHLHALRRLRSGPFDLAHAVSIGADAAELCARLIELGEAARSTLPAATLHEQGTARAAVGKPVSSGDFTLPPCAGSPSAWFDASGRLVAVGLLGDDGQGRVLRGFCAQAQLAIPAQSSVAPPGRAR